MTMSREPVRSRAGSWAISRSGSSYWKSLSLYCPIALSRLSPRAPERAARATARAPPAPKRAAPIMPCPHAICHYALPRRLCQVDGTLPLAYNNRNSGIAVTGMTGFAQNLKGTDAIMFGKGSPDGTKGYGTTIESKVSIEGNIYTEASLFIAGKLSGDIRSDGDVFVGSEGMINGNIFAKNVCVAGTVEGRIEAGGFLKLLGTGKLYGDITVFRLITDEGAIFEGKCSMTDLLAIKSNQAEIRKLKSDSTMFRKKDYIEDPMSPLQIEDSSKDARKDEF
jgi:cytoskeletal protein CcmA (bactofilin family)